MMGSSANTLREADALGRMFWREGGREEGVRERGREGVHG